MGEAQPPPSHEGDVSAMPALAGEGAAAKASVLVLLWQEGALRCERHDKDSLINRVR